jgi:hypothetical protein
MLSLFGLVFGVIGLCQRYAKDAKKIRVACEDMCHLRQTLHLAPEMGAGLGVCPLLFGSVSAGALAETVQKGLCALTAGILSYGVHSVPCAIWVSQTWVAT